MASVGKKNDMLSLAGNDVIVFMNQLAVKAVIETLYCNSIPNSIPLIRDIC